MCDVALRPAKQIASHRSSRPNGLKRVCAQPSRSHIRHYAPEKRPHSTRHHFHGRYEEKAKNDSCERQPIVSAAEIGADDSPGRIFPMINIGLRPDKWC
jgi:hypothetical protein